MDIWNIKSKSITNTMVVRIIDNFWVEYYIKHATYVELKLSMIWMNWILYQVSDLLIIFFV